ncbi:MAG: hypothetical protein NZ902_02990 [Acidilobaceae archaeon]|nr:hypothetical protein [Acidilobaceae archaeon]MCX8165784.1 hypothetical protein [Acidilobaceae archaeon]MDW7974209.1 hypothetical protein [Sulfolobales archaeon]
MYRRRSSLIVTTSRRPSKRTRSLSRELALLLGATRITRGKKSLSALHAEALRLGAKAVIIIANVKGNPGVLRIYNVSENSLAEKATFRIEGVSLAREARREVPPGAKRLSMESDGSPIAREVVASLQSSLPPSDRGESLVLRVEGREERAVVTFLFRERVVGPTLKLKPLKK